MPRINKLDLDQINRQFDRLDTIEKSVQQNQQTQSNLKTQIASLDFEHGKLTTNNLVFTWTGATHTISWGNGFLQDKNAIAQVTSQTLPGRAPKVSSAPGALHNYPILAGSTTAVVASTYYWAAWNPAQQLMVFNQDAGLLYQNSSLIVICQFFTGTSGQTGAVGGGGVNGITDLSGLSYKLF